MCVYVCVCVCVVCDTVRNFIVRIVFHIDNHMADECCCNAVMMCIFVFHCGGIRV